LDRPYQIEAARDARSGRLWHDHSGVSVFRGRLRAWISLALFAAAVAYLWREIDALSGAQLWRTIHGLPVSKIGLAAALTLVNYGVLTGYDQLAFVYLGRRFPRWQISLASFVGYAISNSLGFAFLSGASARYRFYSRWGLSAHEVSRIVIFYSGTFWLGLIALGGWSLVIAPPPGLASLPAYGWARPVGLILIGVAATYVIASFFRRGEIRLGRLSLPGLPSPRLVAGQLALSVADWMLAAVVLWVLLPARAPFVTVLSAFVAAQFAGLVSNVPGGLLVFEGSLLALLGPSVPTSALLSAMVAYRLVYYLFPLALALLVLVVDASYERRHVLRRWGSAVGAFSVSAAPRLLALCTFAAGALLLFSGAVPAAGDRLRLLRRLVPLPIVELSHFLNSLIGLGLLVVSQALARRVDAAWSLAVGGLVLGAAVSLLKGLDYEEAMVLGLVLALIVSARREFTRRARLFEQTSAFWLTSVLLIVCGSIVLGIFAFRDVQYSDQLWWRFEFRADAPRFLRATIGLAVALAAIGLRILLSPAVRPLQLPDGDELRRADEVIAQEASASSYLIHLGDKALLWNDAGSAFLMYAVQGRTWVALHDPIGPALEASGLIERFLEVVDDTDGIPVFYEVRRDHLHHYADFGLSIAKAGEEAIVPLGSFSLDGGARKKMRFTYNRLERDGATFRLIPARDVPAVLPRLREISDEWLAQKGAAEKGFSLGFFDDRYLTRFPVAVLEARGRIEAFANVWPGPRRIELSVDLMRHRTTAPRNAIEGLLIFLMLWGRQEGYQHFNLGMAPLSGLHAHSRAPLSLKVASYVYRFGQPFYSFQGVRAFKEKFSPEWQSTYIAYPVGLLPRVLADVSALIAGGYRRLLKPK
jgi:phosphatidylglycerol lysyltransferase